MQEGVSAEASAFAGHFGLDNLILIYDNNAVTLDAMANVTQSEDTGKRFRSLRFRCPEDRRAATWRLSLDALNTAKARDNGKPQMIIAHTLIGKGIPEVAGTNKAHGEAGAKYVDAARKGLGLPEEHYFVSQDVRDYFAGHKKSLEEATIAGRKVTTNGARRIRRRPKLLDDAIEKKVPSDLLDKIPAFPTDAKIATRKAGQRSAATARESDAISDQRQRRSPRLDPELHRRRRRFHPR